MKASEKKWLKTRWFEFRVGHTTYLNLIPNAINSILLAFNFVMIAYLGLDNNPLVLAGFVCLVVLVYVPVAVLAGHFHNTKQLSTDNEIHSMANPVLLNFIECFKRIEASQRRIEAELDELKAEVGFVAA